VAASNTLIPCILLLLLLKLAYPICQHQLEILQSLQPP
jgi:hypothetical protein